jgi:hypothetical protein
MRLQVRFDSRESDALLKLAQAEFRDPREQVRLIVRRELQRRRLLSQHEASNEQPAQEARPCK